MINHQEFPKDPNLEPLRFAVRFMYDLQKLRIQSGNRNSKQHKAAKLTKEDKEFLTKTSKGLRSLEAQGLKEVERHLRGIPIWEEWLRLQKGCGPTMAGFLISETNIRHPRCSTVSQLWAWFGLHVTNGQAERRRKGQKSTFSSWRRAKMVHVLGGCLLKACSLDDQGYYTSVNKIIDGVKTKVRIPWSDSNPPWRKFYDDYKHRKQNQQVDVCMRCEGKGEAQREDEEDEPEAGVKKKKKIVKCWNCGGTGGPAPWGKDDKHRHQAAQRKMVKEFLLQFHVKWRELEGLPVRPRYEEEFLNRRHNAA